MMAFLDCTKRENTFQIPSKNVKGLIGLYGAMLAIPINLMKV